MYLNMDIVKKLNDFTLRISYEGSAARIGILGASGCGKSMTLKSIAGIEKPDKGRIVLGDRTLFDQDSVRHLREDQSPSSGAQSRLSVSELRAVPDYDSRAEYHGGSARKRR